MARIVIVNDEPELLGACQMVLEDAGHDVATIDEGEKSPEMIRDIQPDAVLLDFIMSGTNGAEVLARLKDDPRTAHIPVLMMSALQDGARRAAQAGADAYLPKPFDGDRLVRRVADLLRR
jgi:DNA-binding response OmpR family regulator